MVTFNDIVKLMCTSSEWVRKSDDVVELASQQVTLESAVKLATLLQDKIAQEIKDRNR